MSMTRFIRVLLAASCLLLALPALAAAASYEVESAVDQADETPGDGICKAVVTENCTLRAAVEELNLEADPANTIDLDPTVFNGEEQDTIFLGSPLQTILYPVSIEGESTCTTAGISGGPCAGVVGTGSDPVFAVEADDSSISGLSIDNGSVGIGVFGESTGFRATGNWIGQAMSGSNYPNLGPGIFLGPGSDGATIGGSEVVDRNVIVFNEVGLDIEGASGATVLGNWFGVEADGLSPGPAEKNIEITNYKPSAEPEVEAKNNEIGAVLDEQAQESTECDGGCNVISSANGPGIDLNGDGAGQSEAPASGPTTIHGNFVGLDPAGTKAVEIVFPTHYEGNKTYGVLAGGADHVTVGGNSGSETNFIAGGTTAIVTENGDDFEARGNEIGRSATGGVAKSPSGRGVFVFSASVTEPATIAENEIRMEEGGEGIAHRFIGATIDGNVVEGGEVGIESMSWSAPTGSLIEGNLIEDTEEAGILVGNPDNEVLGNEILRTEGTGIEVSPETTIDVSGNLIGGNSAAEENAIFDSGGFAILLRTTEDSRNEVGRNHGSGNEGDGGFIVLRPYNGPENDPNGAKHPIIVSAGKTEASGTGALPGALVRVFRKASPEEGELAGFLGEAVADPSGEWKVSYAAVPGETLVTATQTNVEGGTSDLSEAAMTPPDPPAPPTPCSVNCAPAPPTPTPPSTPPPPPPVDTTKPKVTIKQAPKAQSTSTTARFRFVSNEAGSTFQCKLDKKAFARCGSPKDYKKLKPGKHVFKLKATDAAGNVSAVVTRKFTVLE